MVKSRNNSESMPKAPIAQPPKAERLEPIPAAENEQDKIKQPELKTDPKEAEARLKQQQAAAQKKIEKLEAQIKVIEIKQRKQGETIVPTKVLEQTQIQLAKASEQINQKLTAGSITFEQAYDRIEDAQKRLRIEAEKADAARPRTEQPEAVAQLEEAEVIAEVVVNLPDQQDPNDESARDRLNHAIEESLAKDPKALEASIANTTFEANGVSGSTKLDQEVQQAILATPDVAKALDLAISMEQGGFDRLPDHVKKKIVLKVLQNKDSELDQDTKRQLITSFKLIEQVSKTVYQRETQVERQEPTINNEVIDNLFEIDTKPSISKEIEQALTEVTEAFNETLASDSKKAVDLRTDMAVDMAMGRLNYPQNADNRVTEAEVEEIFDSLNLGEKSEAKHKSYKKAAATKKALLRQVKRKNQILDREATRSTELQANDPEQNEEQALRQVRLDEVFDYFSSYGEFKTPEGKVDTQAVAEYKQFLAGLVTNPDVSITRNRLGVIEIDLRTENSIAQFARLIHLRNKDGSSVYDQIKGKSDQELKTEKLNMVTGTSSAKTKNSLGFTVYNGLADSKTEQGAITRMEEAEIHSRARHQESTEVEIIQNRAALMIAEQVASSEENDLYNEEQVAIDEIAIQIFTEAPETEDISVRIDSMGLSEESNKRVREFAQQLVFLHEDIGIVNNADNPTIAIDSIIAKHFDDPQSNEAKRYRKNLRNGARIDRVASASIDKIQAPLSQDRKANIEEMTTQILALDTDKKMTMIGGGVDLEEGEIEARITEAEAEEAEMDTVAMNEHNSKVENQTILLGTNRLLNQIFELNSEALTGTEGLAIKAKLAEFWQGKSEDQMSMRQLIAFMQFTHTLGLELPKSAISKDNTDESKSEARQFIQEGLKRLGVDLGLDDDEINLQLKQLLGRNYSEIMYLSDADDHNLDNYNSILRDPELILAALESIFVEPEAGLQPAISELGEKEFKDDENGMKHNQALKARQLKDLSHKANQWIPFAHSGEAPSKLSAATTFMLTSLFGYSMLDYHEAGLIKGSMEKQLHLDKWTPFALHKFFPKYRKFMESKGLRNETSNEWYKRLGWDILSKPSMADHEAIILKTVQEKFKDVANLNKKQMLLLIEAMGYLNFTANGELERDSSMLNTEDPQRTRERENAYIVGLKQRNYNVNKNEADEFIDQRVARMVAAASHQQHVWNGSEYVIIDADPEDKKDRRRILHGTMTREKLHAMYDQVIVPQDREGKVAKADMDAAQEKYGDLEKIAKAMMTENEALHKTSKEKIKKETGAAEIADDDERLSTFTILDLQEIMHLKDRQDMPGKARNYQEYLADTNKSTVKIGGKEFHINQVREFLKLYDVSQTKRAFEQGSLGKSDFFRYAKIGFTDADAAKAVLAERLADSPYNPKDDKDGKALNNLMADINNLLGVDGTELSTEERIYEITNQLAYGGLNKAGKIEELQVFVNRRDAIANELLVDMALKKQNEDDEAAIDKQLVPLESKYEELVEKNKTGNKKIKEKKSELRSLKKQSLEKQSQIRKETNNQEKLAGELSTQRSILSEANSIIRRNEIILNHDKNFKDAQARFEDLERLQTKLTEIKDLSGSDPDIEIRTEQLSTEIEELKERLELAEDVNIEEELETAEEGYVGLREERLKIKEELFGRFRQTTEEELKLKLEELSTELTDAKATKEETELKIEENTNSLELSSDTLSTLKSESNDLFDRINSTQLAIENLTAKQEGTQEEYGLLKALRQQKRDLISSKVTIQKRIDSNVAIIKSKEKEILGGKDIEVATDDQITYMLKEKERNGEFEDGQFVNMYSHRGKIKKQSNNNPNDISFLESMLPAKASEVDKMFGETHEVTINGEKHQVLKDTEGAFVNGIEDTFGERERALLLWNRYLLREAQTQAFYDRSDRMALFWKSWGTLNTIVKMAILATIATALITAVASGGAAIPALIGSSATPYLLATLGFNSFIGTPAFSKMTKFWLQRKYTASDALDTLHGLEGNIENIIKDPTYNYGRGINKAYQNLAKIEKNVLKRKIGGVDKGDVEGDTDFISRGIQSGSGGLTRVLAGV